MILRRVAAHLRRQEWTAIAIDFVIVVAGVYVGIEVSNWNTERQNRELANGYLQRLHAEVVVLVDDGAEAVQSSEQLYRRLQQVQAYFNAEPGAEASALGAEHCVAVGRSHIYARAIILPPTLGELLATGRVLLIKDEALRSLIASFAQSISDIGQLRDDIQIDRLVLARKYPDLIQRTEPWARSVCDFEAMRDRSDFRNDLADNTGRFGAYAEDILAAQRRLQLDLHSQIDRVLHIMHAASSQP